MTWDQFVSALLGVAFAVIVRLVDRWLPSEDRTPRDPGPLTPHSDDLDVLPDVDEPPPTEPPL